MAKGNTDTKAKTKTAPPKAPPADKPDPNTQVPDPQAGDQPPAADKQPDPPPPANDKKSAGKDYVCLEPVKHNGKRHQPDDPIELTKAEAKPLLDQQAIRPA